MSIVIPLFLVGVAAAAAGGVSKKSGGVMTVRLPSNKFRFVKATPTETPSGRPLRQTETLAPDNYPWIVKGESFGLGGITIAGTGWDKQTALPGTFQDKNTVVASDGTRWVSAKWRPGDGKETTNEVINKWMTTYVLPAVATIVGATVGGPAGAAAAMAITVITNVARGQSLTRALADAAVRELTTGIGRDYYLSAYNKLASVPYSAKAIEASRSAITKKFASSPATRDQAVAAFVKGAVLGKAKRTQDRAKKIIASVLPKNDADVFKYIMQFPEVTLDDWAYWDGGPPALAVLDKVLTTAAKEVDAGTA